MLTYTIRPTAYDDELTSLGEDEDFTLLVETPIASDEFQARIVEICVVEGWSGAHVFAGAHGPIYDAEGREENYHGWIDARDAY